MVEKKRKKARAAAKRGKSTKSATAARRPATRRSAPRRAAKKSPAARRARSAKAASTPSPEVELEAAVFRRLVAHFDSRKDVQNIELMILAGFCRNCLSKWLVEAANERGIGLDIERAREKVYGMPYAEWKERYQQPATDDQMRRFDVAEKAAAAKPAGQ
jgi:hypothetical protein